MEAGKRDISIIFNRGRILRIPHFQRSYVWGEEQWGRFLEDMEYAARTNFPYFMGSIILKQQEGTSDQRYVVWTIIDGQQRLTTILLFFKALFNKKGESERFFQIFSTYSNDIILEHNYSDKPTFEKILLDQEVDVKDKSSKIYQCYDYFLTRIKADEIDPNHLLSNVSFVGIDLQFQEDEQQIFDTINSLGVRLTTAELLKNYFFNEDVGFYNTNWRDIFEKDDDIRQYWEQEITSGRNIRTNIDLFLQSYLFIKIQEPKLNVSSDDKERFFKIDSVFNSYKELIIKYHLDKNLVINELKEYATIYKNTINPEIVEEDVGRDDYAQRLNLVIFGLDITTIIPYVLYVSKKVTEQNEKNNIFKYLEAYLVRRLVCKKTAKNYNQLFRSFINNGIDTLESLKMTIETKSDKINNMPSDDSVREGVRKSDLTNRQAKGVLYLIERSIRSDLNSLELKDFNDYSLEHIMPKKWKNNWGDNNLSKEQADRRDELILTLGNFTLITKKLNSSISDSNWDKKREGSGRNHGLNEYAQGMKIFSKYLQRDKWDDESIEERGEELGNYAINDVWKIDPSNLNDSIEDVNPTVQQYDVASDEEVSDRELSDTKLQQLEFWNKFKNYVRENDTRIRLQTPRPQHWYDVSMGSSESHVALTINSRENLIGCEIYISRNKDFFNFLRERKIEIEKEIGETAEWVDAAVASRVTIKKEVSDIFDQAEAEKYFAWLYEKTILFQKIFGKYFREFKN